MPVAANIIFMRLDSTIPDGYVRDTTFNGKYPRGASGDGGGTGGTATHKHTTGLAPHLHPFSAGVSETKEVNYQNRGRNTGSTQKHVHPEADSGSPTDSSGWSSSSNDLYSTEVIFIKSLGTRNIPTDTLVFSGEALTGDFKYCDGTESTTDLRNRHFKGSSGASGGATHTGLHSHTETHGHNAANSAVGEDGGEPKTDIDRGDRIVGIGHQHAITFGQGTSIAQNALLDPLNYTFHVYQNKGAESIQNKVRGLWLGTVASIPINWTKVDGISGRFVKNTASSGATPASGGTGSHNHTETAHNHVGTQGEESGDLGTGEVKESMPTHVHTWGVDTGTIGISASSAEPEYVDVIFIEYTAPAPRWFHRWHRPIYTTLTPKIHLKCNDNAANTVVTNDGSLGNGVATVNTSNFSEAGKISQCFHFNDGEQATLPFTTEFSSDTTGTFGFWWYMSSAVSNSLASFSLSFANGNLNMRRSGASNISVTMIKYSPYVGWIWTSSSISGGWHYITITHNGTTPTIKIDNSTNGDTSGFETDKTVWFSQVGNITEYLFNQYSAYLSAYANPYFDDFRYYDSVLTDAQLTALYNGGNGTEETLVTLSGYV